MSLLDLVAERIFKQLTKLQQDILQRNVGSDFYQQLLKYVSGNPVYMSEDVEKYISEGYLFNPLVYSIVSFIAQKASTIPFSVYEVKNEKMLQLYKCASPNLPYYLKQGVKVKALTEIPDHELNQLFISPNEIQPWSEFIEQTVGFKLVTGNSYTHCIGPDNGPNKGMIKELWNLPSQIVTIIPGDSMELVRGYEMAGNRSVKIPAEEVIHLKYWTPEYANGTFLYGLSPIRAGRRVVTKSNASYDSSVSSFQNMGAVGFVSQDGSGNASPLTEEQASKVEERLAKKTGPRNRGKYLVTSASLKWQQVGMSPVDLGIIESDRMDLRMMCNLYHVPSELFNDAANKTYSNTKEAGSAVYTNAVIPALVPFRDALNQKIRSRYENKIFIDFDTSMISELQDDLQMMSTALSGTWWLTPNQRRSVMSFDEDEEQPLMDDYWIPAALLPMSGTSVDQAAIEAAAKALGIKDYV
jgi:HK97 family phage portal protein